MEIIDWKHLKTKKRIMYCLPQCVLFVLLKDCFLYNLTLLLSLLVTGGRETTALVESLTTAYISAPSTRFKYLQRQKEKKN